MTHQPDDIRRYIRLTEASFMSKDGEDVILEGIEVPDLDTTGILKEDIGDMIFKLRSYSESDTSADYARGVEEGLALAANMLERLLERHSDNSNK